MRCAGFTLLEVIVSSMLLSIVMSAATALMFVNARAVPVGDDPGIAAAETIRAMDMLASELAFATSITTAEPRRVEFVIRDRDSDGEPDTISYRWSGVTGDPWTRTLGNTRPQPVIASIAALDMSYTLAADGLRITAVHVSVHPQGMRSSVLPVTVRMLNQPAMP